MWKRSVAISRNLTFVVASRHRGSLHYRSAAFIRAFSTSDNPVDTDFNTSNFIADIVKSVKSERISAKDFSAAENITSMSFNEAARLAKLASSSKVQLTPKSLIAVSKALKGAKVVNTATEDIAQVITHIEVYNRNLHVSRSILGCCLEAFSSSTPALRESPVALADAVYALHGARTDLALTKEVDSLLQFYADTIRHCEAPFTPQEIGMYTTIFTLCYLFNS